MSDRYVLITSKIARIAEGPSHYEGASLEDIGLAEVAMGVRLPESYKWFLQTFGAANLPELIYGLGARVPPFLNVIENTLVERTKVIPPMYSHLIPVTPDGFGNHWCLDTSRFSGGECPVVFWYHDRDNPPVPDVVVPTFLDLLEQLVDEALASE